MEREGQENPSNLGFQRSIEQMKPSISLEIENLQKIHGGAMGEKGSERE